MARRFAGDRLVVATHNAGKLREIVELLAPLGIAVVSAGDLGLPEPEETGLTFAANAELKALAAATASGLPALADDSGVAVAALNGAPGIYTARWAGEPRDWDRAMARVEQEILATGGHDRRAEFVSALTLAWPDGVFHTVEGRISGTMVYPPRGSLGFGFDPVFVPEGQSRTFGEFTPAEKAAISHRTRAFALLLKDCFG